MKLAFYDCYCQIGPRSVVYPHSFDDVAALDSAMEYFDIQKVLLYHSLAREYNPAKGNALLNEVIKSYPIMVPMWVVMPSHTGEFPEPDVLVGKLKADGIKTVTMFPVEHGFSLSHWNSGEMLKCLERNGIILLLELEQISWDGLYDMLDRYPGLNIILTGLDYAINRNIYPLLKVFPQLYLETSGVKAHSGIEDICARFGAGRLVFGSGMPVFSGGAAVAMIQYASISEAEKRMIAHENLEKLLGGVMR
jgi:Predicted metal-dependent hydrolase of the TIM-barrel fold